jgi:hypothetical protein
MLDDYGGEKFQSDALIDRIDVEESYFFLETDEGSRQETKCRQYL